MYPGCKPRHLLAARSWSTGSLLGSGNTPVQLDRTDPEAVPLLSQSLESVYLLLLGLTSWSLCCRWLEDSGKSLRQCPSLLLGVSRR